MLQPAKSIQLAVSRLGRGRSAAELHWDCYHGPESLSPPPRTGTRTVNPSQGDRAPRGPDLAQHWTMYVLQCWRVFPLASDWSGATGAVCHCCWSPRCLPSLPGVELSGVSMTRSLAPAVVGLAGASVVLSPRTTDTEWLLLAAAGQSPPRHQTPCLGLARPARPAAQRAGAVSIPQLLSSAELNTRSRGTQGAARGPARGPGGPGGPASGGVMSSPGCIRPEFPLVPRSLSGSVARLAGGCGPGLARAGAGC